MRTLAPILRTSVPLALSQAWLHKLSYLILRITLGGKTFLIGEDTEARSNWVAYPRLYSQKVVDRAGSHTSSVFGAWYAVRSQAPHTKFLRHRWDGGERKPRAALGKETLAKVRSLSLCLDTSHSCAHEVVVFRRAMLTSSTILRFARFLRGPSRPA